MKFRVERDVLADAVAWAARSLPARPPVPVLAGLLVEAAADGLTLSSFDYEVSARVDVAADVRRAGAGPGVRPAARRHRRAACRPRPVDDRDRGHQGAAGPCGRSRSRCRRCRSRTTRRCPTCRRRPAPSPARGFAAAVAQVAVAAGRDDTLPMLTGIRMEIEGDTLTLAATDRYRLAVRELAWTPEQPGARAGRPGPGPHPRRHGEVARRAATSVTIALSRRASGEGLIGFEGGGRRTTTRLLDGEFPKYRSLLPDRVGDASPTSRPRALVEAVKRVALVAERNTPVRLTLHRRRARARRRDRRRGAGDRGARAARSTASRSTIAFNPQFLLDGLGAVDDAGGPAVVHHADQAGRPHRRSRATTRYGAGELPLPAHAGPPVRLTAAPRRPRVRRAPLAHRLPLVPAGRARRSGRASPRSSAPTARARPTWSRRSATSRRSAATGSPPTPPLVRPGAERAVVRVERRARRPAHPGRARDQPGPGQPRPDQPLAGPARPRGARAAAHGAVRPRGPRPGQGRPVRAAPVPRRAARRARRRGWPACGPTTTGCSSSATPC